jgi:phosphoribosylformimino-5-aminoimidazole carboxamide ribotide isomerase
MRIIPVIDIKESQVVRGIAGRRSEYRPVVSRLTHSTKPLDVAEAFRTQFGLTTIYLADLDAIAGAPPLLGTFRALQGRGFQVLVDAGMRDVSQVMVLADAGVQGVVLGLETIDGPDVLGQVCRQIGFERIFFSLDLKDGRPLGNLSAWTSPEPFAIAEQAIGLGIRRLILLDLARVGMGEGTGTEPLGRKLRSLYPNVEVIVGGGVRDAEDLRRLEKWGASGVLVASALHDGRLASVKLAGS